jgi:hypothetical protein
MYGDNNPRFFTYWTVSSLFFITTTSSKKKCTTWPTNSNPQVPMQNDAYQETGCYNLFCSGFVQTSNRIAVGAAISPISSYNGRQFDVTILIWKVPTRTIIPRIAATRSDRAIRAGPEAGPLVAAAERRAGGVLAVVAVHPPGRARRHGAVRRRGGGGAAASRLAAHAHADGQRPVRRRGVRARGILPQRAGRRLGQQPRLARGAPAPRRPPRLLRHRRRQRRRVGHLLLLRRPRQERPVPVAMNGRAVLVTEAQTTETPIPTHVQGIN